MLLSMTIQDLHFLLATRLNRHFILHTSYIIPLACMVVVEYGCTIQMYILYPKLTAGSQNAAVEVSLPGRGVASTYISSDFTHDFTGREIDVTRGRRRRKGLAPSRRILPGQHRRRCRRNHRLSPPTRVFPHQPIRHKAYRARWRSLIRCNHQKSLLYGSGRHRRGQRST